MHNDLHNFNLKQYVLMTEKLLPFKKYNSLVNKVINSTNSELSPYYPSINDCYDNFCTYSSFVLQTLQTQAVYWLLLSPDPN